MSAVLLVVEVSAVFVLTLLLLDKYGNWRRQHFIVTISTFIGWFFSFTIIFILPLDIAIVSCCCNFVFKFAAFLELTLKTGWSSTIM